MPEASQIHIGDRTIGAGRPTFVIAEIGINHGGDAALCAEMIAAAAAAGADAIKLQTIDPDANYVRGSESHTVFTGASLSPDQTGAMFERARDHGIVPFTTAGDFATLAWVDRLAPGAHKISSGLLTNLPVIRRAAATGRPLVLSTGMAYVAEIDAAVAAARSAGATQVALLQCTSLYPAPPETLNLAAIGWLAARYGVPVGFSDHSLGTTAAPFAVAAGAALIEKHFTLDRTRPGFDHRLSLEPQEFAAMVEAIRAAERMMGMPEKQPVAAEQAARDRYHRCLVAARPIAPGERFDETNIALKRPLPGTRGLEPDAYDSVLGRRCLLAIDRDEPIPDKAVGHAT